MTLPYSPSIATFMGNGLVKDFPFNFKVWDASQLVVSVSNPDGMVENIPFSAQLGENGGTVTALYKNAPVPLGYALSIVRNMPFEQGVDLVSGTRFDPQVIEDQLDKATAERQQLREELRRAVKIPSTSTQTQQELLEGIYEAKNIATAHAATSVASAAAAAQSAASALGSERDSAQSAAVAVEAARIAQEALEQGAPTATSTIKGVVYLSDAVDSVSDSKGATAATPMAVRKVRDFALDMCWNNTSNYVKPCTRLGSNGRLYLWRAASGPAVEGVGAKDPTTDEGKDFWLDNKKDSGFIGGGIIAFSGAFGGEGNRYPIPRGDTEADSSYVLCDGGPDGMGGTVPDLRGRFILGGGGEYEAGNVGGAATHCHILGGSTEATTLSTAQMPSHGHGTNASSCASDVNVNRYEPGTVPYSYTGASVYGAGSSGAHSHTLTAQSITGGNLPPYYALAYIIKL